MSFFLKSGVCCAAFLAGAFSFPHILRLGFLFSFDSAAPSPPSPPPPPLPLLFLSPPSRFPLLFLSLRFRLSGFVYLVSWQWWLRLVSWQWWLRLSSESLTYLSLGGGLDTSSRGSDFDARIRRVSGALVEARREILVLKWLQKYSLLLSLGGGLDTSLYGLGGVISMVGFDA